MEDYLPGAPTGDAARLRNEALPGMGGVFNTVNMAGYTYAANNPVKYVDPNGQDNVLEIFNRRTGALAINYLPSFFDVGASRPQTYNLSLSNHVSNELNGERAMPDANTTPADGGQSQFYYPRQMPLGIWNLGRSREPSTAGIGSLYISTDAVQVVPVYGPYSPQSEPPSGDAAPIGTQRDTAYGFHRAANPINPSSWGCGVTVGTNADQDIRDMAKISDAAIDSGGRAKVKVVE